MSPPLNSGTSRRDSGQYLLEYFQFYVSIAKAPSQISSSTVLTLALPILL